MVGLPGYCKSLAVCGRFAVVSLAFLAIVEKQISLCPYVPHYCAPSKTQISVSITEWSCVATSRENWKTEGSMRKPERLWLNTGALVKRQTSRAWKKILPLNCSYGPEC